ncbi:hypothetical protein [Patulibacter medicamentivorans]|uniref:hypothetical protein n=1 Tax=Patulibacter medicamentivorans TaxID=1097667 RepID=UPI001110B883|nr:hypothetical protein [Patulibacter medicamentivorans]
MRILNNMNRRSTAVLGSTALLASGALAISGQAGAENTPAKPAAATFGLLAKVQARSVATSKLAQAIQRSQESGQPGAPLTAGPMRSSTETRSGVPIDIATDGSDLCYGDASNNSAAGAACAHLAEFDPNLVTFSTSAGNGTTRVIAIAPDGIGKVSAVGADGATGASAVLDNVAVVEVAGDQAISSVSWTLKNGEVRTQTLGTGE